MTALRIYEVKFEGPLGQGPVPPSQRFTVRGNRPDTDLAEQIWEFARKRLASALVDVCLSLDQGRGFIYRGGHHIAGEFRFSLVHHEDKPPDPGQHSHDRGETS